MSGADVKAPDSVAADRALGQSTTDATIVASAAAEGNASNHDKAFTSLAARAALGGCGLYRLADGELLLTRWGMAKTCPDLRSVAALLDRMVGPA